MVKHRLAGLVKNWLILIYFLWGLKVVSVKVNVSTNFQICICTCNALHCVVFLCLTSMMKMVNYNNKDQIMPHLLSKCGTPDKKKSVSTIKITYHWNVPIYWYIGGSPLSDWKLCDCKMKSLSMPSISCCTRPNAFISLVQLQKKVQLAWTIFQSLMNNGVKGKKAQIISAR